MLQSLEHNMPLLNGYSGFFPESYEQFREAVDGFPDSESVRFLIDRKVGYIVVQANRFDIRAIEDRFPAIEWLYNEGNVAVARLEPAEHEVGGQP